MGDYIVVDKIEEELDPILENLVLIFHWFLSQTLKKLPEKVELIQDSIKRRKILKVISKK